MLLADEIRNLLPLFWGIQGYSPPGSLTSSYPALLRRVTNNDNHQKITHEYKHNNNEFLFIFHKAD
ncbi:hypothetical protein IC615_06890 [Serratia ureilytica]